MVRWILFVAFILFVDFYAYQSIKILTKNNIFKALYWMVSFGISTNLLYKLFVFNDSRGLTQPMMLAFGLLILSILPKIIMLAVLFSEDVFRVLKGFFNRFGRQKSICEQNGFSACGNSVFFSFIRNGSRKIQLSGY